MTNPKLRIGRISYSNTHPFFFEAKGLCDDSSQFSFSDGVPSEINQGLQSGQLDMGLASSVCYAQDPEKYVILPQFCIAGRGRTDSVILVSSQDPSQLKNQTIYLTTESLSAVHLLKVLMTFFYQVDCRYERMSNQGQGNGEQPYLLIGDQAMEAVRKGLPVWDLSALWESWMDLPFCFALWLIRRDALPAKQHHVQAWTQRLQSNLDLNLSDSWPAARDLASSRAGIDAGWMVEYWRHLEYNLDSDVLRGLEKLYELAEKAGFISQVPKLSFWEGRLDAYLGTNN